MRYGHESKLHPDEIISLDSRSMNTGMSMKGVLKLRNDNTVSTVGQVVGISLNRLWSNLTDVLHNYLAE